MKLVLILPIFFTITSALVIIDSALASACMSYIKRYNWGCHSTGHSIYHCVCPNVDWLGSVANCAAVQGRDENETRHAWQHIATRCLQNAHVSYTVDQFELWSENATSYLSPNDTSSMLKHPVSVNASEFKVYLTSYDDMVNHVFKSQWFSWSLIFFWVLVFGVCAVVNLTRKFTGVSLVPRRVQQIIQKYLMPTVIFGLSRLDILIMFLFVVQVTLVTALSYDVHRPNMYIKNNYLLTLDLIGYRTALLAFAMMPVTYIFGIRNNPFCVITGLPQNVFIRYHKFCAMILAVEAMIHSVVWTVYPQKASSYALYAKDDYFRYGICGTVILYLMLFQSFGYIRKRIYEIFLAVHKIFGWVFIVTMWYHVDILGWMGWVYALIGISVYDRVLRYFKIFSLNRGFTTVKMTVLDDRTLKLTVPKSLVYDSVYRPGHYIYLSFFHKAAWYKFYQSHPFTIVASPVRSQDSVSLLVRVKTGTTKDLARLKTDEKGSANITALIDGPYGNSVDAFKETDAVACIVGGVGITAVLPTLFSKPRGSMLFWSVRDTSEVDNVKPELDYLTNRGCDVQVFCRAKIQEEDSSMDEGTKYLTICNERPDVSSWVAESIDLATSAKKTDLYILSCGPDEMDHQVQKSVCEKTVVGSDLVIHHKEEKFCW